MSKRSQLKGDNNDSGNKKKRKVDETKEEIGDLEDLPDAFVHHKKSMHNFSEAEIGIIREKLLQVMYIFVYYLSLHLPICLSILHYPQHPSTHHNYKIFYLFYKKTSL